MASSNEKRTGSLPLEDYYMACAFLSAMRSKDPVTKVGAVLVNETKKRIVGLGYNGMPDNCSDETMPWKKEEADPLENKYLYVCHAAMNAILNKFSTDLRYCTAYVAMFPCNNCAKMMIQSGIKKVLYLSDKHKDDDETKASKWLLDQAEVTYQHFPSSRPDIPIDFDSIDSNQIEALPEDSQKPLTWEEYFMSLAFLSGMRSKDPVTQVGAVIVNPLKRIVGLGYNGMPNGCPDDKMPWGKGDGLKNKNFYVCHAEMNAIANKYDADIRGCTVYVSLFPCNECTKLIIQSGIKEVIYKSDKHSEKKGTEASKIMLEKSGVVFSQFEHKRAITIKFDSVDSPPKQTREA